MDRLIYSSPLPSKSLPNPRFLRPRFNQPTIGLLPLSRAHFKPLGSFLSKQEDPPSTYSALSAARSSTFCFKSDSHSTSPAVRDLPQPHPFTKLIGGRDPQTLLRKFFGRFASGRFVFRRVRITAFSIFGRFVDFSGFGSFRFPAGSFFGGSFLTSRLSDGSGSRSRRFQRISVSVSDDFWTPDDFLSRWFGQLSDSNYGFRFRTTIFPGFPDFWTQRQIFFQIFQISDRYFSRFYSA